jgi:hypothetical protein
MSTYLILKRGGHVGDSETVWFEVGEVEAGYPQKAITQVTEKHGQGEYLAISHYGRERFTVSARTQYDVEPTLSAVEVAA